MTRTFKICKGTGRNDGVIRLGANYLEDHKLKVGDIVEIELKKVM